MTTKEKMSHIKRSVLIEIALLKALAIKDNYTNYYNYIMHERLLIETQTLLDCYKDYYTLYPDHKYIDFEMFLTQFTSNWHAKDMNQEDIELYRDAITKISHADAIDSESALLGLI